ncbi:MAG: hypothetical protein ACXWI5_04615 [Croceibacterium sp.]
MTRPQSLALLIPLALLGACHKTPKNDARSASGEVLQGTISDNMLPLDKLKSQPPLLAPSQEKNTPEGVADKGSGATSATTAASGQPDAGPSPAPSASGSP